jgi:superoxide dismutase, Cu-Zn family
MPMPTLRRTSFALALAAGAAVVTGATLAGAGMAAGSEQAAAFVSKPQKVSAGGAMSTADPMSVSDPNSSSVHGSTAGMDSMAGLGSTGSGPMPSRASRQRQHGGSHQRVEARLHDVNGKEVAWVELTALHDGGSLVRIKASGLTPGFHGFHLHANGICDPAGPKPFASAGGHFNPTGNPEGMQAGAFPVLLAGSDGYAAARFVDANIVPGDLVTPTGTSVVIHSLPDNYANIPTRYFANGVPGPDQETMQTGDGGTRIACGVLVKPTS